MQSATRAVTGPFPLPAFQAAAPRCGWRFTEYANRSAGAVPLVSADAPTFDAPRPKWPPSS